MKRHISLVWDEVKLSLAKLGAVHLVLSLVLSLVAGFSYLLVLREQIGVID